MSSTWLVNNAPLIIGIAMMLLALAAALAFAARQDRQLREQDEAIAHYRALFDSLGDGIAYFDGNGRLALWDEGFEEVIRKCGVEVRRGETAFELADRIPGVQMGFDREEEFERVRMGQRVEREFHLPDGPTFNSTTWQAADGGFAMSVQEIKLAPRPPPAG